MDERSTKLTLEEAEDAWAQYGTLPPPAADNAIVGNEPSNIFDTPDNNPPDVDPLYEDQVRDLQPLTKKKKKRQLRRGVRPSFVSSKLTHCLLGLSAPAMGRSERVFSLGSSPP